MSHWIRSFATYPLGAAQAEAKAESRAKARAKAYTQRNRGQRAGAGAGAGQRSEEGRGPGPDLHETLDQHHGDQGGVQPASICRDISHGLQDTQALIQHALGVSHVVTDWGCQPRHVCLHHSTYHASATNEYKTAKATRTGWAGLAWGWSSQ